jgi:hypothetical protein
MSAKKPATKPQPEVSPPVGVYEAAEPLFVAGVRAHSPGDRVLAEHVDVYGWHDKVRRVDE